MSKVRVTVNGIALEVPAGTMAAAAAMMAGATGLRTSVSGEPRGALCGMGICFECRATIDGVPQQRSCQTMCREGMEIRTA